MGRLYSGGPPAIFRHWFPLQDNAESPDTSLPVWCFHVRATFALLEAN